MVTFWLDAISKAETFELWEEVVLYKTMEKVTGGMVPQSKYTASIF